MKRKIYDFLMKFFMRISAIFVCLLVLFLVVYIFRKGLPNITWHLLSTKPSYLKNSIGILPDILNTFYIIIATLFFVLPVGVGAAIYLTEYAKNKKLVKIIEFTSETLSSVPSVIYGLFGMLFFCQFLSLRTSLLAGALTLSVMTLPTILRTTQESLKTVPDIYREGAFGLGAGKWRV
ncbi:MAG: ABC transporter permease subunit, partial [Clostridia bacterium]|nr:ABC transporter permease subunit [Clostridia bacterium]